LCVSRGLMPAFSIAEIRFALVRHTMMPN